MTTCPPWFAVRTVLRREQAVVEGIRRIGYPAWAPVVISERGRARREIRQALIPGYVFTACGPFGFGAVAKVDGALAFLRGLTPSGERHPHALPANDLVPLVLAEMFGDLDHRQPVKPALAAGAAVRITSGMWRGYMGELLHQAGRRAVIGGVWGRMALDPGLLERVA